MQTLNLQARDGQINNAFLHDVQSDLGAGGDLGVEGEGGGDGHGGAGLDLHDQEILRNFSPLLRVSFAAAMAKKNSE